MLSVEDTSVGSMLGLEDCDLMKMKSPQIRTEGSPLDFRLRHYDHLGFYPLFKTSGQCIIPKTSHDCKARQSIRCSTTWRSLWILMVYRLCEGDRS